MEIEKKEKFSVPLHLRLSEQQIKEIKELMVNDEGERFTSISHFVRCSVIEKLRNEK